MVVSTPTLAVVIVNYNTRALLDRCLETLTVSLRTHGPDAEILVIDNGSSDDSVEMLSSRYPDVRVERATTNRGFGGGANLAIGRTRTPYVLVMNPDTEVMGDAPAALVRFMAQHQQAGIVGGQLRFPDGRFQDSCFRFPTLAMSAIETFLPHGRLLESPLNGRYPRRWYRHPFPVDHPLGAVMLARRDCLDRIGGFDESFFMYCEEIDLCWRARAAGFQVWYTPTATFVHHAGAATRQFRAEMQVALRHSRAQFIDGHYGTLFSLVDRVIFGLGLVRDLLRDNANVRAGKIAPREFATRRDAYRRLARP